MTVTIPTITAAAGYNFLSSSSKVLTLYNVQSEEPRKSAGIMDLPMPTLDSDGKIVMDLLGASREITVEGIVTADDVGGAENLYKYACDIVGLKSGAYGTLINGAQGLNQYTYACMLTQETAIKVCIIDASAKYEKGNPNSFPYSITMIEYGTLV